VDVGLKAVLLLNLGTPSQPDTAHVRRYLRSFLNDPRVVDLPAIVRWPLVNGLIIPLRVKQSTENYKKIWRKEGSPLLVNTANFAKKLAAKLGDDYHVEFAMRYGSPSIKTAMVNIMAKQPESLHILPLFPQYAEATTGSALAQCYLALAKQKNMPSLKTINHFYAEPAFIEAYAKQIAKHIKNKKIDKLMFSYHGLPERQANTCCYREQCFMTSQLLAESLGLTEKDYVVSFQSRIGRARWIQPDSHLLLPQLIRENVKHLAVVCPSFVADCLETLEEVNIRMREQWQANGGSDFTFVPCLNDEDTWVEGLARNHLTPTQSLQAVCQKYHR